MSQEAEDLMKRFAELPALAQLEVFTAILEYQFGARPKARPRRVADIAGRFSPLPLDNAKAHDDWFAEAIIASKSDRPQ